MPKKSRIKNDKDKSILGRNSIFTPNVMNDIHIKSQLGRYRMRGMALMKKIPHWDDLTFLPGTLTSGPRPGLKMIPTAPGPKFQQMTVPASAMMAGGR